MLVRFLACLLALFTFVAPAEAGWWDNMKGLFSKQEPPVPPKIRVLIAHDQDGAVIEVKGKYSLYDPKTDDHISTRFMGKRKFMQALVDGLKWDEEFPGVHQLWIVPNDGVTTVVNGIEYHGSIYVYDVGGTISIVNEIGVEDYLKSLLAPQFRDPLPAEALAAVAIAARTNTYYQIEKPRSPFWSVDGRKIGYEGYAAVTDTTPIEQAIDSTRFMIMTQQSGTDEGATPFPAQWGSITGGKSASDPVVFSRISLFDAADMAGKGEHAAQILQKAFPEAKIVVMQYKL